MVRVRIERDSNGAIARFRVSGHAGYAERGRDIVCAAVSAVTVGTVNAVEALTGIRLRTRVGDGRLEASLPDDAARRDERVQLLLESMVVMLRSIAESYGEYVRLTETDA
ncbi:MAG: hypothetical protein BLM47_08220 [Candidatus Reconcilbacillus cellulovorans]|uniref:Ribosomal processing cysteine protease Prp n=1 Tax=Candidatus Reconcilbacillus cellulovorans TaxID=1906605 RepID=A0A2A6E088_9BACL|nr:MAG: hypothetical protein BLM47_08220 [Candidatus Reconcilbacillus cellulovorans]